ncbi:MAG: fasciclin domain-containing protein [Bacteroidales bacterium]
MKNLLVIMIASVVTLSAFGQGKDVVDIAIGSADHTTLVAAVKAADLVSTLKSDGPFTVFAPTNAAFDKLPAGTVEGLLKPESKAQLSKILTYHVVSGNLDAAAVIAAVKAGNGEAVVTTVSGGKLKVTMEMDKVKLTDESGNSAYVVAADLKGSNGIIHVIDSVVLPI